MRNVHTQGYNGRIMALIVINKQSLINVLPSFVICKRSICTTCASSFGRLLRGEESWTARRSCRSMTFHLPFCLVPSNYLIIFLTRSLHYLTARVALRHRVRFPIGGKRVSCHGSNLTNKTNQLPKETT